ncbi:hypothetical protein WH96_09945 [Kiloniella spongiae]|uniref:Glycine zipper family protein n=2 Tax=Kiloniella spongiae TaxID=1489064 RepID=A0A0H2MF92_9PROT|nr:hypothetical protein WH96_09945 [Kiloniella spongiae]
MRRIACWAGLISLGFVVILLGGCSNTGADYRPIVDGGADTAAYESDLTACAKVADQRDYLNGDVQNAALLGTGLGAAGGAGAQAWDTQDERKQIVKNCMKGRGHNVVG